MFEYLMPTEAEINARVQLDLNPDMPVMSMQESRLLCAVARRAKVRVAVETGSFTGASASAMELAGTTVFSIDNWSCKETQQKGVGCLIRDPELHNRIIWLYGKGVDKIPQIARFFGNLRWMFFHDSDHSYKNTLDELNMAANYGAYVFACHDIEHSTGEGTDKAFRAFAEGRGMRILTEGNLGIAFPPPMLKEDIQEMIGRSML